MLLKNRGVTIVAVLTLALGIGANTAMFSVADALLFRPLLLKDLDRIVVVYETREGHRNEQDEISPADFQDFRAQAQTVEHLSAFTWWSSNLTGDGEPERVRGCRVTGDFFRALGMDAALGRTLLPDDDRPGGQRVVVLSHGLWQRRYAGDAGIVRKTMQVNGQAYEIAGVMPHDFQTPPEAELWVPMAMDAREENLRGSFYLETVARIKPGYSLAQVNAEMSAIARRIEQEHPNDHNRVDAGAALLREHVSGELTSKYTSMLLWAVSFVLLIACSNVANLQFARVSVRSKEIAVRAALGAGRWRLIRQLLTESVLLALLGAALGLVIALWGVDLIKAGMPAEVEIHLPGWRRMGLNYWVLSYTLGLAILSGIVAGVAPALLGSRPDVSGGLKESGRGSTAGLRRHRARNILVFTEIVLAVVLLSGAGIMVKGFRAVMAPADNVAPEQVLTMRLSLPESRYPETYQMSSFAERFLAELQTIPGAQQVALIRDVPYSGGRSTSNFYIEGRPEPLAGQDPVAQMQFASENYFRTAHIPLVEGREFTPQDTPTSTKVAIVSVTLVRRYFPGESPIGKRLKVGGPFSAGEWYTVAGVASDILHSWTDRVPRPVLYRAIRQTTPRTFQAVLRTEGDPLQLVPALRERLRRVDAAQPMFELKAWNQVIRDRLVGLWYVAVLMSVLGGIALALSTVGVYSVMAYAVSERTHEIGVRMALGAQRGDVLRLFMRGGLALMLVGLVVGLVAALALGRTVASLVYGVSAYDFGALFSVSLTLSASALLACYVPARRASRVDPMVALRYE
jgi:putative ABC transport system permease protein